MGTERENVSNYSHPVGFGYITIPYDSDRDKYIKTCMRKERVAVKLDDGGSVLNNCYISREALQRIKFPLDYQKLGSAVAFIVPKFHNIPIIVGILSKSDESQLLEENDFKHEVNSSDAIVSIQGKGNSGELYIDVNSDFEDGGNIYITLKNNKNKSKFNVKCFGDVNIYAEGDIASKCSGNASMESFYVNESGEEIINAKINLSESGFIAEDKFGNKIESNSDNEINIVPTSKCNLFEGSEPLVKGNELKKQLETMSNRIQTLIDSLNAGAASPGSIQTYITAVGAVLATIENQEDLDNINSEKSFTD